MKNTFLVGVNGGRVVARDLRGTMMPEEAIELAAQLIVAADQARWVDGALPLAETLPLAEIQCLKLVKKIREGTS